MSNLFGDYDPYEQLQECIAQTNENTRMVRKLVEAHNKLDGIVMELTQQHTNVTELLVKTRSDLINLIEDIEQIQNEIK